MSMKADTSCIGRETLHGEATSKHPIHNRYHDEVRLQSPRRQEKHKGGMLKAAQMVTATGPSSSVLELEWACQAQDNPRNFIK